MPRRLSAVLAALPLAGHRTPLAPVAAELERRGHEARFFECDLPADVTEPDPDLLAHAAAIARAAEVATPLLVEALRGADVLLYDSMTLWGRQAARAWGGPAVNATATFALDRAFFPIADDPLAEVYLHHGEDPTVVFTSREFQPHPDRIGGDVTWVGPPTLAGSPHRRRERPGSPNNPGLVDVRGAVYAALGTLYNDRPEIWRAIAEAFEGERVVMAVGHRVALDDLGPHVEVHRWVDDQRAMLERASLFVTHSGMNSVQEALACGVPLLLLPQTDEQRVVARRVEELGAGRIVAEPSPEALAAAGAELRAGDAAARAAEIGRTLRGASGAPAVADVMKSAHAHARTR